MEYEIRPLQLRALEILKVVDAVCRDRGLRYYMMAGTLLGAVRHGGFIPWDDDLDIGMPRHDYDLLLQHAEQWLPAPMEMVAGERDALYPLPFAKIQDSSTTLIERAHLPYLGGIYIDVFPLDGVPSNMLVRRLHYGRYEYLKRALYFVHRDPYKHGRGIGSWLPLAARKVYSLNGLQEQVRRLLHSYDYDSSTVVGDYDDGLRGAIPKSWLGKPQELEFEGHKFYGPARPELYLSNKYGDYMTIPKVEHQRKHNFHFLDLNKGYRD